MKDINTYLQYLTKIEHVFSEDLYVGGEEVLDTEKISFSSPKPPLFKFVIENDKAIIYAEIILKSAKLNDHTCSCQAFNSLGNCKHLVASYLILRRDLLILKDKPKPKTTTGKKRKNSKPISEVIKNVSSEDLLHFVHHYAKLDKKFSTALKVHFLSQSKNIVEGDIKHILDSIIPPVSSSKKTLSATEWSLFTRTLDDFIGQIKDNITISKFDLAANLIINSITKLYYIINKFESREGPSINFLIKYIEETKLFFKSIEAPITRNKFAKKFASIHDKSYITNCIPYDVLHVLLDEDLLSPTMRSHYAAKLFEIEYDREKNKIHQLSFVLRLSCVSQNLLEDYLNQINKNLSTKIMSEIYQEQDIDCIKSILNSQTDFLNTIIKEEFKFKLATNEKNYSDIFESLKKLLIETKDIKYYDQLKSFVPDQISNLQLEALQDIISTWPPKDRLDFFVSEQDYKSLQSKLIELMDLELTFHYDQYFPSKKETLLFELYSAHLKNHLENHVGIHSSEQTAEILRHIQHTKERTLYLKVVDFTLKSFGDRKSIKTVIDFSV